MAREDNYVRLPLSVTPQIKEYLEAEATRQGESVNAVARMIFRLYIDIMAGRIVILVPTAPIEFTENDPNGK